MKYSGAPRVAPVVGGERVVEAGAQDRVDADDARAEIAHAGQPAVVVGALGASSPGAWPGSVDAEVHARPEARRRALGQHDPVALDARGQLLLRLRRGGEDQQQIRVARANRIPTLCPAIWEAQAMSADVVERLYAAFDRRDGEAMAASTRRTAISGTPCSAI